MSLKLCLGCRYIRESLSNRLISWERHQFAHCSHQKSIDKAAEWSIRDSIALVAGVTRKSEPLFCSTARGSSQLCGEEALWFEAKE